MMLFMKHIYCYDKTYHMRDIISINNIDLFQSVPKCKSLSHAMYQEQYEDVSVEKS